MPLYSVMIQMIISRTMQKYWQIVEPTLAWLSVDLILAVFPIQVCDPLKGGTSTSVWHAHGDQFWSARADFPRKISKENTRNNFCLTIWVKENWNLIRNLWKETKVGKRRTREFSNRKLIQVRVSCWFANLFWALPQKLYAFKLLWLTNSCDTTWA